MQGDEPGIPPRLSVRMGAYAGYAMLAAVVVAFLYLIQTIAPIAYTLASAWLERTALSSEAQGALLYFMFVAAPLVALLLVYWLTNKSKSNHVWVARAIALIAALEVTPSTDLVIAVSPSAAATVERLTQLQFIILGAVLVAWALVKAVRWLIRDERRARTVKTQDG